MRHLRIELEKSCRFEASGGKSEKFKALEVIGGGYGWYLKLRLMAEGIRKKFNSKTNFSNYKTKCFFLNFEN